MDNLKSRFNSIKCLFLLLIVFHRLSILYYTTAFQGPIKKDISVGKRTGLGAEFQKRGCYQKDPALKMSPVLQQSVWGELREPAQGYTSTDFDN